MALSRFDNLPQTVRDELIRRYGAIPDYSDYVELYDSLKAAGKGLDIGLDDVHGLDYQDRQKELQRARRVLRVGGADFAASFGDRDQLSRDLDEMMEGYAVRVEKHKLLESYLDKISYPFPPESLRRKMRNMHDCHGAGIVGVRPDGGKVIAWDHKCNDTRMCPHAAWKESKRLIENYHAAILEELDRNAKNRLFYTVLTAPNTPEGSLIQGKRELFEQTKAWLKHDAPACPLVFDEARGKYLKDTKPFSMADCVRGSLVTQEDPAGANYQWHVHNNLILITQGQFDYALAREWWSEIIFGPGRDPRDNHKRAVLHFSPVERETLGKTLIEIIKYPVLTVGEKSLNSDTAPAMIHWPPSLFFEWYNANHGFRRTRSYGSLYAIERTRWNTRSSQERYDEFFQPARETRYPDLPLEYVQTRWQNIPEQDRAKLKRQMRNPDPFTLEGVRWVGNVLYLECLEGYYVDLSAPDGANNVPFTLGDNFFQKTGRTNNFGNGPPVH